jgi:uncharacterized protein (DUF2141 family)
MQVDCGCLCRVDSVGIVGRDIGGVRDKKEPIANAVVVAIPEPKYRKRQSRYQRTATDQDCRFTLRGLHPGEYTVYAWEILEGDDYQDPDFLKSLEGQGSTVKVDKSSRQSVALKVIPAPADQP